MTETYFKKGDKVTCNIFGLGVVTKVDYGVDYPVFVQFDRECRTFTTDGRYGTEYKRTLHQGHINIPEPILVPIVEYTKDEVVYYRELTYWYIGFYQSDMRVRSQAGDFCTAKEIRKLDNPPEIKL